MRVNKIIVDGDYFDTYGLSRFIRYKDIPLIEEFNTGIALCKLLCEHFPEVVFSVGNHEMRVFKYFANQGVGIDKMFLVNYDWVAYMATLFPNITIAKNLIGNENTGIHELKHYYILGKDCAVGHFEFPGGGKHNVLKAAHTTNDWADKFDDFFEPKKDIIALSRNISIAQSEIEARIAWHDRNFADLKKYFS
jgi:hypothetical protein